MDNLESKVEHRHRHRAKMSFLRSNLLNQLYANSLPNINHLHYSCYLKAINPITMQVELSQQVGGVSYFGDTSFDIALNLLTPKIAQPNKANPNIKVIPAYNALFKAVRKIADGKQRLTIEQIIIIALLINTTYSTAKIKLLFNCTIDYKSKYLLIYLFRTNTQYLLSQIYLSIDIYLIYIIESMKKIRRHIGIPIKSVEKQSRDIITDLYDQHSQQLLTYSQFKQQFNKQQFYKQQLDKQKLDKQHKQQFQDVSEDKTQINVKKQFERKNEQKFIDLLEKLSYQKYGTYNIDIPIAQCLFIETLTPLFFTPNKHLKYPAQECLIKYYQNSKYHNRIVSKNYCKIKDFKQKITDILIKIYFSRAEKIKNSSSKESRSRKQQKQMKLQIHKSQKQQYLPQVIYQIMPKNTNKTEPSQKIIQHTVNHNKSTFNNSKSNNNKPSNNKNNCILNENLINHVILTEDTNDRTKSELQQFCCVTYNDKTQQMFNFNEMRTYLDGISLQEIYMIKVIKCIGWQDQINNKPIFTKYKRRQCNEKGEIARQITSKNGLMMERYKDIVRSCTNRVNSNINKMKHTKSQHYRQQLLEALQEIQITSSKNVYVLEEERQQFIFKLKSIVLNQEYYDLCAEIMMLEIVEFINNKYQVEVKILLLQWFVGRDNNVYLSDASQFLYQNVQILIKNVENAENKNKIINKVKDQGKKQQGLLTLYDKIGYNQKQKKRENRLMKKDQNNETFVKHFSSKKYSTQRIAEKREEKQQNLNDNSECKEKYSNRINRRVKSDPKVVNILSLLNKNKWTPMSYLVELSHIKKIHSESQEKRSKSMNNKSYLKPLKNVFQQ